MENDRSISPGCWETGPICLHLGRQAADFSEIAPKLFVLLSFVLGVCLQHWAFFLASPLAAKLATVVYMGSVVCVAHEPVQEDRLQAVTPSPCTKGKDGPPAHTGCADGSSHGLT